MRSGRSWIDDQRLVRWQRTATVPPLGGDEIHLWWVPLRTSAARVAALANRLNAAESARAGRFRLPRLRDDWVVGRATLRLLLGAYLRQPAAAIRFEYGPVGKPRLARHHDARRLCFNYSDSGGRALYAFAWDGEVGVDLEYLPREVSFSRIARRKFTGVEAAAILSLPPAQQRDAFLACWTRKEGYGKAVGVGIRYPLDSVELCLDCAEPRFGIADPDEPDRFWQGEQVYPSREFVGTVVCEGRGRKLGYYEFDHEDWD